MGKNLEFYFENVKCEVLAEYPHGEKWQLGRGIWVWRSGEWPGLHLKSLRTVYKAAGMDEVTHWVREHRSERDIRQLWGVLTEKPGKGRKPGKQCWERAASETASTVGEWENVVLQKLEGQHLKGETERDLWIGLLGAFPFPGKVLSHLLHDHF